MAAFIVRKKSIQGRILIDLGRPTVLQACRSGFDVVHVAGQAATEEQVGQLFGLVAKQFADQGVNLTNVTSITIGSVEGENREMVVS